MYSQWSKLKIKALSYRKKGKSLRYVSGSLKIPKSTLSGWFKNIELNDKQKLKLKENQIKHLADARKMAVTWHNQQKENRIKQAEKQASIILSELDISNMKISQLALAMLYLGEGTKTRNGTSIGNSDPLILRFFVHSLIRNGIDISKIKCSLHLRADQNPELMKKYWAKKLRLPLQNFTSPSIDLRTSGHSTYTTYNGVCVVSCGNIALQRQLIFLSRKFCEKILTNQGS